MKFNRKTILTIFVLLLFSGSIISLAAMTLFQRDEGNMANIAILKTSKGIIEIELYPEKSPKTVENFKKYLEEGFYDGLVFHRVIDGFMIQAGGFYPDGTYKESYYEPIENEAKNGLKNTKGTIAMARTSDPNSATTQFFINTMDNQGLDYPNPDGHGYAVFGKVIEGIDVVEEIESEPTGDKNTPYGIIPDWPKEDVIIIEAYIKEG
jgi:peptidyl-prolyl cis-trans isomerase A (cyclophilin A)